MKTTQLNAVGYVRCSTEMQEDSPDQQKKEILAFAKLQGYVIIEWFVDFGKSGTTFDQRPEFQRLRTSVENKPSYRMVICYDESRWGRAIDAEENTYWRVYFRRYGIDVILVKTSVDRNNDFAPMLSAFEGVQASQYSKKLSELTLRGAMNNSTWSNGGTAPYGYVRIAVNTKTGTERILQSGDWAVSGQEKVKWGLGEAEEIVVVQRIFSERVTGKAYILIAQGLNESNIPCPKRGRWRNSDQKWSTVTIKSILDNPVYYGARVYNRNSMSKIQAKQKGREQKLGVSFPHWRNQPEEWNVVENAHDGIISKELWTKANTNTRVHNNIKRNGHSYRSQYLLTGLIRCSHCGFAFQGWSGAVKGQRYYKYIDGGWQNKRVCSFFLAFLSNRLKGS